MAFRIPKEAPGFADLKTILAQTKDLEDPLYQTLRVLIDRLSQFKFDVGTTVSSDVTGPVGPQGPPGPPGADGGLTPHHVKHEPGGSDFLVNSVWSNLANIFTQDQLVAKTRPDLQLQHQGDISKSHLEGVTPNNLALTQNLFFNGTSWMKDDTTVPGTLVNMTTGGFSIFTSAAAPNPAALTQILSISPSGNLTIPGSISAVGGIAPGPHHTTHEPGGSDVISNVAWLNLKNSFTKEQTILNESGDIVARFSLMNMTNPLNQRKWLFWAYTDFLGIGQFFDDESGGQPSFEFHRDGRFIVPEQVRINSVGIPRLQLMSNAQPTNQKIFEIVNNNQILYLQAVDDAVTASVGYVSMTRSGIFTAPFGLGATPLNASQLVSGMTNPAVLGSGTANSSTFLRGDNTWQSLNSIFPSGLVVISPAPCPPGWTRVTAWDGLFLRSGPSLGLTGGANSHSHGPGSFASQGHQHAATGLSEGGHNHGGSTSISGSTSSDGNHAHSANLAFSNTTDLPTSGIGVPSGTGAYYGVSDSGHRHGFSGTASGNTDAGGTHSHSFSGSGGISVDSSNITGQTAVAGALGITGVSDVQSNLPPFIEAFFCQKN